MRFKVDENLPVEIATILIRAGHDAQTVFDENLVGSDDGRLHHAYQKERRSIITLDLDFADTRKYAPSDSAGIVVIRASVQEKDHLIALVARLVPILDSEKLDKHLWIVDEGAVRIRGEVSCT